jgi:hypothetical protein
MNKTPLLIAPAHVVDAPASFIARTLRVPTLP